MIGSNSSLALEFESRGDREATQIAMEELTIKKNEKLKKNSL